MGARTDSQIALNTFLKRIENRGHTVEPDRVIARDNIFRVDGTIHLMVRTSRYHEHAHIYFYGLTHHIFENFALLPNAVIAFLCTDTMDAILLPAQWLWKLREKLSTNQSQYKLHINKTFQMRLFKGAETSIDLTPFREQYSLLETTSTPAPPKAEPKAIKDRHSYIQGMLLEIGNLRGFQTYSPNKSPRFNGKPLAQISTVSDFPEFPGLNTDILRQIDVVWMDRLFPVHAFEVELTTGIWSGLVRLGELRRLNTELHIVTDSEEKVYRRRISGDIFSDILAKCHHANAKEIEELYQVESRVHKISNTLHL